MKSLGEKPHNYQLSLQMPFIQIADLSGNP